MDGFFLDWHLMPKAGGLVNDWQIGIGLPFDKGNGQGFAMGWWIGNRFKDQYMGSKLTYL